MATLIRSLASSYAADLPISLHSARRHVQLIKSCELLMVWMAHLVVLKHALCAGMMNAVGSAAAAISVLNFSIQRKISGGRVGASVDGVAAGGWLR